MNLLLVDPGEVGADGVARIGGRRAEHVARVLGATPGARVRTGVLGGAIGQATVIAVGGGTLVIDLAELATAPAPERGPPLDVILAVPRPKALSRTVQTLAAMGVRRVDLVNAWRVDASYFVSPRLGAAALDEDARLGAEQGVTTHLPVIEVHRLLVPFLVEVLAPRLAAWRVAAPLRCVLAHPAAAAALERIVSPGDVSAVVLAIGPEGGWIDRELESFTGAGFAAATFGPAVLRTETAVAAAVAQIALLRRLRSLDTSHGGADPDQAWGD